MYTGSSGAVLTVRGQPARAACYYSLLHRAAASVCCQYQGDAVTVVVRVGAMYQFVFDAFRSLLMPSILFTSSS